MINANDSLAQSADVLFLHDIELINAPAKKQKYKARAHSSVKLHMLLWIPAPCHFIMAH